jgi:addiction module HigA family antidote
MLKGEFASAGPVVRLARTTSRSWTIEEIGVSPTELARQLAVPANRISQIVQGKRAITGDTALRLGHWFGMSPQFWLNLQRAYDLHIAEGLSGAEIRRLPTRAKNAA